METDGRAILTGLILIPVNPNVKWTNYAVLIVKLVPV